MSGISSELKKEYPYAMAEFERKYPYGEVLDAKDSMYPVFRQKVTYALTVLRKCNVLEEFVMKAASLGLSEEMDIQRMCEIMGMDEVFLEGVAKELVLKNVISKDDLPVLKLTSQGEKYLGLLSVPDEEEAEEIEYLIDKKFLLVYCDTVEKENCDLWDKYTALDKYVENAKKYISRKFICEAGKIIGKEIEDEKTNRRISSVMKVKNSEEVRTLITEFTVIKEEGGKKEAMVYDHAKKMFRNDLSAFANKINGIKGKI